ncbi:MAG: 5-(carboxyamino)imidazole ribonucleotide mutase [Spirochaetia bacterium]
MSALVGVIMGSDSDLRVMSDACRVLEELEIEFETTIVSAHRTPHRMVEYAEGAAARGIRVIIAGAGGAAHLPGMVAALTDLPVIGVPVRAGNLEGLDSLLSIVQMPRGVPVATVAINGARNAGLLAARVLGVSDTTVRNRVAEYRTAAQNAVVGRAGELEEVGYVDYLSDMDHRGE